MTDQWTINEQINEQNTRIISSSVRKRDGNATKKNTKGKSPFGIKRKSWSREAF